MIMDVALKTECIALWVAGNEKDRLMQAADLQGLSLSTFMLNASRTAADLALGNQTRFVLPKKQMIALNAALDAPPRTIPQLKALFARPSLFRK